MTTVHISFSHVAQRLSIAPRTTRLSSKLHSIACSYECCCSSAGGRAGRRRHRFLCGRTRAPAGSALSWTPRVSRARITKYGRAPTDFGSTSAATLQTAYDRHQPLSVPLPCLHITLLTNLTSAAVSRAVRSAWVKGRVPFCQKYCIQHTVDTTLVVT